MLVQGKIHILMGTCLKYFTYRLVLVLAPSYKQQIFKRAKVRKVYYSLAELHVKCVYWNLFGWTGRNVYKIIKGGRKL
jgi:hypothetical protein